MNEGSAKRSYGKHRSESAALWKIFEGRSFQIENPPAIKLLIKVEQDGHSIALYEMRLKRAEG